ncbi:DUF397 domain-containing protein [Streptomyces sp. NPDC006670]|uniref:DUF397 domain-containing protein n=1 Tax=Streptomyces sp. NPDC006670 TaxID=3154476 RepID=UPI00340803D0
MTDTTRLYATSRHEAQWRKSTFCDVGERCVEIADVRATRGIIAVRDSKPEGRTPAAEADGCGLLGAFARSESSAGDRAAS